MKKFRPNFCEINFFGQSFKNFVKNGEFSAICGPGTNGRIEVIRFFLMLFKCMR